MVGLALVLLGALYPALGVCPSYSCETFSDDLCVKWGDAAVALNSVGCQVHTLTCSISQAIVAYQSNPQSGNFSCQTTDATSTSKDFNYCGEREESQRYLASGQFPKECTSEGFSDSACMLNDLSYDECKCGMDSKLYCQPSASDVPFDYFWDECDDLDDVVSAEFYSYYRLLHELYVEYHSAPSCANSLFYEFAILSDPLPQSEYDSAVTVLALVWLTFV
jgi:hypothetical protein